MDARLIFTAEWMRYRPGTAWWPVKALWWAGWLLLVNATVAAAGLVFYLVVRLLGG